MRLGLPRADRADGPAGSHQQSRRSDPRLLCRLADLGECDRRDRTRRRVDTGLALGRPIVAAFMAPLLALAMARNREWRVDIHVSRQVVLHTATLVASGCFLVAVAVVAILLRGFGGDWGLVLQLAMLFGSIVVLATVLSSGSVRRRLKFLISRNFYTHRYDYRVEWL